MGHLADDSIRWAAIVGRTSDGRQEAVADVLASLNAKGLRLGGFLQRPSPNGIVLEDAATGERVLLAERRGPDHDVCDWRFQPSGFEAAARSVDSRDCDVLLLHAGRLEGRGHGHWSTIVEGLMSGRFVVLTMPPSVLASIALELPDPCVWLELPCEQSAVRAFTRELSAAIDRLGAAH